VVSPCLVHLGKDLLEVMGKSTKNEKNYIETRHQKQKRLWIKTQGIKVEK
jgi:septum formation topological specificity factor MinE